MEPGQASVNVTIRCFAAVREILGTEQLRTTVEAGSTVEQLLDRLAAQQPKLRRISIAFAVNRDYARGCRVLREGDEVAFIPPISGGAGAVDLYRFELSDRPLDPRVLEEEVGK